jgi:cytochrome P450
MMDSWPIPINRSFNRASRHLRELLDQLIAEARTHTQDSDNLLSLLIRAQDLDTGQRMTDEQIRDELVSTLTAGWEPTATMVAWAFYELGRDREAEQRLHTELDTVVGDAPITADHLAQLSYLRQVLAETNRMHAAPILMRRTTTGIELGGYTMPAGTELGVSLYALHRDPRFYSDPDRFDPDRWNQDKANEIPRHGYVPFGDGTRRCAGEHFAHTEMTISLATIARRCRLEPLPGNHVRETFAAFAKPDAVPMIVRTRVPATTPTTLSTHRGT